MFRTALAVLLLAPTSALACGMYIPDDVNLAMALEEIGVAPAVELAEPSEPAVADAEEIEDRVEVAAPQAAIPEVIADVFAPVQAAPELDRRAERQARRRARRAQ